MEPPSSENLASSATSQTAYIGNLRSDRSSDELETEIQRLFESVGVTLLRQNVEIHRKSTKRPAYGFISLKDKATFDLAVGKFHGISSVEAKELIYPGKTLELCPARRNQPSVNENTQLVAKNKKNRKHSKKSKHKHSCNSSNVKLHGGTSHVNSHTVVMATDSVAMATNNITQVVDKHCNAFLHQQISHLEKLDLAERFYYMGQKLGTENRLTEYKQGGGSYLDNHFKIHVGQYVCAFLNSEGGTLLVGVKDDCTVCGVKVSNHHEDQLRLEIDKIMKGFNPPVFTNSYKVNFVPVYTSQVALTKDSPQAGQSQDDKISTIFALASCSVGPADLHEEDRSTTEWEKLLSSVQLSPTCGKKLPPLKSNSSQVKHSEFEHKDCKDLNIVSLNTKLNSTAKDNEQTMSSSKDAIFDSSESSHLQKDDELHLVKSNLKVIEVKVSPPHHPRGEPIALYENNKGEVYIRRDGSIQGPLKASQILAWSRQNIGHSHHLERNHFQQEIERKQGEIEMNLKLVDELVKQKQFLEDQYQEKIEKLKENENKLNTEIDILRGQESRMRGELEQLKKTNSKVCVLL